MKLFLFQFQRLFKILNKIFKVKKNNFALAGIRTRVSRVAGENSTTEQPMLLHSFTMNLQARF